MESELLLCSKSGTKTLLVIRRYDFGGTIRTFSQGSRMEPVISPATSATKRKCDFEPGEFLVTIAKGRRIGAFSIVSFSNKQGIFAQGGECDAVFYIQEGKVKLTVASKFGKEATISLLSAGDFLGEDCLAGQRLRLMSATTVEECLLVRIEIDAFKQLLHQEQAFSDMFMAYLLARNFRY
jgi:CRP/FNR family cyclic AMP-dependent transcriptional regulator